MTSTKAHSSDDRSWVYRVPTAAVAVSVVRTLDRVSSDVLQGLGVVWAQGEEGWYVFANALAPSGEEVSFIERTLESAGQSTLLTIEQLLVRPFQLLATGPVDVILQTLRVSGALDAH